MNKPRLSLAIFAIGLLLLGAACQPKDENENTNEDSNTNSAVNENRNADSEDDDANVNGASNTNSSDDDGDDDSIDSNTNSDDDDDTSDAPTGLRISKPEKGETVSSPFEVAGKAYTNSVTVRVLNTAGTSVISVPVTVRNNEYKVNLTFAFTNTTTGKIEVEDAEGTKSSVDVTFKVETDDTEDSDDTSNSNTNSSDDDMEDNTNSSDDENDS